MMSNMKIRKSEQRREGLLARLNVDTDQLLGNHKSITNIYVVLLIFESLV